MSRVAFRETRTITALYDENGKLTSDRVVIRARMQQIYASESAEPDPEDIQFSRFTFLDMKRRYEERKAHAYRMATSCGAHGV
jgi:hypothetical protein